jgi:PKD repeat protein
MKKIFTKFFMAFALFGAGFASAQCALTATLTATPLAPGSLTYMFVGLTSNGTVTSQYLNISPGPVTYNQDTVYYTFPVGGTYQVCYHAYDSTVSASCSAQDCIMSLQVGNNANACGSYTTITNNGNGNYTFWAAPNTPNGWVVSYSWNFGDGSSSSSNPATYSYTSNGIYVVTVDTWAYDPNDSTQYCYGTTYDSVNVQGLAADSCNAAFFLWPDSLNPSVYYGYNTSTGNNLYYFWDFGDGTSSTLQYPNHVYNTAGNYLICLTVSDSAAACTSTYCDSTSAFRLNSTGISSLTIIDPAATTSIKENTALSSASVFPNPVQDAATLNVVADKAMKLQLSIVDMLGQTLNSTLINCSEGTNSLQLNTSQLTKGLYFVRIADEKSTIKTIRLVK